MNPADFVHIWTNYAGNEKSGAKPWFASLCTMLGQSEPGSDPDYTYEKDTKKTGGDGGYADVLLRRLWADPELLPPLATAAKALDDISRRWLDPSKATEAELQKRTLTNLYNHRPTWLQHLHATLDRAVWDAYGWPADEVPAEVAEEVILERVLELNLDRAVG